MDIVFDDNLVVISIDKAVIVLTRAQFIDALQAGKRYRRQQQRALRVKPIEDRPGGLP